LSLRERPAREKGVSGTGWSNAGRSQLALYRVRARERGPLHRPSELQKETAMAQATTQNQKTIISNQRSIISNQTKILRNQKAILTNQKRILSNQARILKK
jgi:hypothetical protein